MGENFNDSLIKDCDEQIAWLKAILLNIKKKNEDVAKLCSNEWNEEDEKHINSIFNDLKQNVIPDDEDQEWLKNRFKSLRPHWKPSKEQMEALKDAVKLYKETHFERFHARIESLYEQLKKLQA